MSALVASAGQLMHVLDGKIVEALGYVKSGDPAVAAAIDAAID